MGMDITMAKGQTGRLEALYYAHIDRAVRLAFLMTGDRQQAQDIAQDAFVKIGGRFADLRDPEAFPAYLRVTVLNLSRGHLRKLRTQRSYLEKARPESHQGDRAPDIEERDEMWRALQELPHRQRAALVLRYYDDLSEQQTAEALGCTLSAVKSLVSRGLEDLRARMRGEA